MKPHILISQRAAMHAACKNIPALVILIHSYGRFGKLGWMPARPDARNFTTWEAYMKALAAYEIHLMK